MSTTPSFPISSTNTLFLTRARVALKLTDGIKTGATGTASTDIIASADHPYVDGDLVEFTSGTGFTGLTAGVIYHARDVVASTSFKLAATAGGAAIDITADGTAGTFSKVIGWETHKVDDNSQAPAPERIELPDDLGVYRPLRTDYSAQNESWQFVSYEIKRILAIFGGAMQGIKRGTAKIWLPDSAQAQAGATTPFIESEWFDMVVSRGGNVSFGDRKHSVATINLESQKAGAVLWT